MPEEMNKSPRETNKEPWDKLRRSAPICDGCFFIDADGYGATIHVKPRLAYGSEKAGAEIMIRDQFMAPAGLRQLARFLNTLASEREAA